VKISDVPSEPLVIESLDQEGRGIARREGKVIFVEGALPGERVTASIHRSKSTFEVGRVATVLKSAANRMSPRCVHFGVCGGCALQHVDLATQVAVKQRVLEDALWHIGKVKADEILSPIQGPAWSYRHRARFTVRYVPKKGGALVGFHEKRSSFVADMRTCEVVPERISRLLVPLRELVGRLSMRQRLPQIELAVGETVDVLVLRVLEAPSAADEALLRAFATAQRVSLYLQHGGPETAAPFHPPEPADLYYALPDFDVRVYFEPTDFTQVNHAVNRVLVRRALRLLAPRPGERIADFFCGLGNFALPIARSGAEVLGVEGSKALLERARENAVRNGLEACIRFEAMDIFKIDRQRLAGMGRFDGMLIDPPRDGAVELVKAIGEDAPRRIVYVSCNPGTLARDAAVLVHTQGYVLKTASVVNMFPHTAHVESIALFAR
jgi:23S rRNA (uracil1939-C5)-methyltransferase